MTLAEILEEGERQIANYQTMILPHGDARMLLAVAKAAVEMVNAENDFHAFYGFTGADTKRVVERRFAAFAALDAAVRGDAGGEG